METGRKADLEEVNDLLLIADLKEVNRLLLEAYKKYMKGLSIKDELEHLIKIT